MSFKPQSTLKRGEFASKGEHIAAAESVLYSNPASAFISWAHPRDSGTSVLLRISAVTDTEGLLSLGLPPLGPLLTLFASSLCQSSASTAWCLQAEVYVPPALVKSQGT